MEKAMGRIPVFKYDLAVLDHHIPV